MSITGEKKKFILIKRRPLKVSTKKQQAVMQNTVRYFVSTAIISPTGFERVPDFPKC